MDAIAIVVVDKAANDLIRLLVTLKIMTLITLRLKYGVERLDVGVLIRRLRRYSLVDNFKLFTGLCKSMANELWTIVRSNNWPIRFVKELALHQCFLRDLNQILGLAGQAVMIGNNRPVEHIDDVHQEEEALLTFDPAILNIRFPQLIGTGNDSVIRKPFGMLNLELPLGPQHIHLFAQPVDFLLVNHKAVLASQHLGQLAVSEDGRVFVG